MITLLIYIVLFAAVAYGLYWVCQHFSMPKPVWWLVGAILLIVLLVVLLREANITLPPAPAPLPR